jgi:hypothetical protein
VNGVLAPKSIVVEVADPVPQGGRQNLKTHYGEHLEMLPGFVPPACRQRVPCEQGRAVGFKRKLVGPAKPRRRERPNDLTAVRLADSTPRSGEPATWGSGQRALNCPKATWPPCKGREAVYAKRRIANHGNRTRTTNRESGSRCCNQSCGCPIGRCRLLQCCETMPDERSAGNPHTTFCGSRRRVTASDDPVGGQ